ncbi:MAG: NAD(P)-dependent alcohol dehydrogenase [Rhodospirillales bacterium]
MRAFELGKFGLDGLSIVNRAEPKPGANQVLVKLRAASLNYRDYLMVSGAYDRRQALPLVPVSDGAGEIVEIGPGVTRVKVGDRVCPIFRQNWIAGPYRAEVRSTSLGGPHDGAMMDLMVLNEEGVIKIPAHLDYVEAATLPCAAVTAWNAMRVDSDVAPGEFVLVQGTGGVSLFALQFAKMAGAQVIITSSSDEKLEKAKKLGADFLINYRSQPDWDKQVNKITEGRGVDHVMEVGGALTLEKSIRSTKLGGQIALIGNVSGSVAQLSLPLMFMRHIKFQGITVGNRLSFEAMAQAIAAQKMHPVVDKVFPFEELPAALAYLAAGAQFGKVCLQH